MFCSLQWFGHRQSATSAPQSCMLVVAANLLEAESAVKVEEREKYLAEKCPPLELPYSRDELMVSPDLTVDRDNTSEASEEAL